MRVLTVPVLKTQYPDDASPPPLASECLHQGASVYVTMNSGNHPCYSREFCLFTKELRGGIRFGLNIMIFHDPKHSAFTPSAFVLSVTDFISTLHTNSSKYIKLPL